MKNKILHSRNFWMISLMVLGIVLFSAGCAKEEIETKKSDKDIVKILEREEGPVMEKEKDPVIENPEDPDLLRETLPDEEKKLLEEMSLEDKVAQMFIVLPEELIKEADCVTAAGEITKKAIQQIPVGGFIYLDRNLVSEEQVKTMFSNVQEYSCERIGLPMFLCVDEEGGTVANIGNNENFQVEQIEDMCDLGGRYDVEEAYETGKYIGGYLSELGFNVDFAPVADVLSNPENTVVKKRSFGADESMVSDMAWNVARGLQEMNVLPVYKHFPGHGATAGDTHQGYAYTDKTLEELKTCELCPFMDAAARQIPFIMTGHISLPNVTGDEMPASMSEKIMKDLLREQMGYEGVIITDAMNMGAVISQYTSDRAAVQAIQSGADIVLMPEDFYEAYEGVLEAVRTGEISVERIDQSVGRIIELKMQI